MVQVSAVPDGTPGYILPERLRPVAERSGLDAPYWDAVTDGRLVVQRCTECRAWQWGPEWICGQCHSFAVGWEEVPATAGAYEGVVYSWERVWHPTEAALRDAVPYVVVLVEVPSAGGVRMVGNLVGEQLAEVAIGDRVQAVFEHHDDYSLVQWAAR
jgi:uncharacterized OB-fold protein